MARRKKSAADIDAQRRRLLQRLEDRGQFWDYETSDITPRARRIGDIANRYAANIVNANQKQWSKMTPEQRKQYEDMRYGSSNAKANFAYNNSVSYSKRAGITG